LRQILKDFFILKECKIGEQSSNIYLLNTNSEDGIILIDTGIGFNFKKEVKMIGLNPKNIKHCLITHGHADHVDGCKDLIKLNPRMRFYIHIKDDEVTELIINKDQTINFKLTDLFREKITNLKLGPYTFKSIHIPGHTPGGMAFLSTINKHDVLFVGDICGGCIQSIGGNYEDFKRSLHKLLEIKADILCDGHMNVIQPSDKVSNYIEGCLKINDYIHIGFDLDPKNSTNWYNLALVSYQLKIYDNAYDACNYTLKLNAENVKAKDLLKKIQKHNPPKYEAIERNLKNIYGENL